MTSRISLSIPSLPAFVPAKNHHRLNHAKRLYANLSSTLAIKLRSKASRLDASRTPAGLLPSPPPGETRKKSPPAPTTPCAPAPTHPRRSGGGLVAPGCFLADTSTRLLRHSLMREERDEREQAQKKRGRRPPDRQLRPLPLVSTPRRRRTSWKVTSSFQRKTNHDTTRSGSAVRSVHGQQGLGGEGALRVADQHSSQGYRRQSRVVPDRRLRDDFDGALSPRPYHSATVTSLQSTLGSSATTARLGRRLPLRRGRPISGRLGVAGPVRGARRQGAGKLPWRWASRGAPSGPAA